MPEQSNVKWIYIDSRK